MINDALLSKFDRLRDLPVSEELLGAYVEGNLTAIENLQIEQTFITNPDFLKFKNNFTFEGISFEIPDEQLKEISLPSLPILENWRNEVCLLKNELNQDNLTEIYGCNKKIKR